MVIHQSVQTHQEKKKCRIIERAKKGVQGYEQKYTRCLENRLAIFITKS